jgi:hypothetical protein
MLNELIPPESVKRVASCSYRLSDNTCCNSNNFLRPHKCKAYCVPRVSEWLQECHGELPEEELWGYVAHIVNFPMEYK